MDKRTVIVCIISLLFVLPITFAFLQKQDQRDKAKINVGAALYVHKKRRSPVFKIYRLLYKFPLTRGYIQKISRRYELICPANPKRIAEKTLKLTGITFLLCTIEILLFYLIQRNLFNFVNAVYLVFVINNEVINYYISSAELRLLEEMERFISNVGDNYFINYYIDEAIDAAIDNRMSLEMRVHAKKLSEIVTSNNLAEDITRYNTVTHNRYLKILLSLCVSVIENGDKKLNGQRLLTLNLINLKKEINLEFLKQKQLRFVFSGAIAASVIVCSPLTLVQKWGVSIAPELEALYTGRIGISYVALLFFTSAVVYTLINYAKEIKKPMINDYSFLERLEKHSIITSALNNFTDKFEILSKKVRIILKRLGENLTPKQLLLKSIILAITATTISTCLMFYIHVSNRERITHKVSSESLTSAGTLDMANTMKEELLKYVNLYKGEAVTSDQVRMQLLNDGAIYNEKAIDAVAQEVVSRLDRYQNEYFKWYELLICFGVGSIAFFMPFLIILFRKRLLTAMMKDEIIQFNSIIYMMMYSEVTVKDILEQMELFAVVFKATLRECLNEYNAGDIIALKKMKDRETYEPFLSLIDSLIRCDDMPLSEAFDKIACDRENYYERIKVENQITIQKRLDNMKPLAFIPAIMLGIYIVVPLFYVAANELIGVRSMINELMGNY